MGQWLSRVVWAGVVAAIFALGVAAPVQMVRARRAAHASASAGSRTAGTTVRMANLAFVPDQLAVPAGTVVVFRNDDVAPHTVTAATGDEFDSGIVAPRKTFRLVVNHAIEFVCRIHPGMHGKIVLTG